MMPGDGYLHSPKQRAELLAELPGVAWVAITEAYIDNYAGMYLTHSGRDARSLFSRLAPSVDEPCC